MERNIFWTMRPEPGESIEKFLFRAQEQANKCTFGKTQQECREICVIDKITLFAPPDLKEKILQSNKSSLDDVLKIVSSHESVKYQASQMVAAGPSGSRQSGASMLVPLEVNRMRTHPPRNQAVECSRCGKRGHLGNDATCPALNAKCNRCQRVGHYEQKCRTASVKGAVSRAAFPVPKPKRSFQRVRPVGDENAEDTEEDKSFIFSIGDGDEFLWIKIGGIMTQVLIDSGSNKNIIDDSTWTRMKAQGIEIRNATKQVDKQFKGYGKDAQPLNVIGMFDSTIEIQNEEHQTQAEARFYVVANGNQPLLGKETAQELNVLRLGLPGHDDRTWMVSLDFFIKD